MPSSVVLHRVAFVVTCFSEEISSSIIRVSRIGELGTTLAVTSHRSTLRRNPAVASYCSLVPTSPILVAPVDDGDTFLRDVGSYRSHTA
jgi:hypothetical protein